MIERSTVVLKLFPLNHDESTQILFNRSGHAEEGILISTIG